MTRVDRLRALGAHLDALVAATDLAARRAADPVAAVHRYADPADREVVAVFAATIAYGRVAAFRPVLDRLLAVAEAHGGPRAFVAAPPAAWWPAVAPLRYRWNPGADFGLLAAALGRMLAGGGTLEDHLPRTGPLPEALSAFVGALRAEASAAAPGLGLSPALSRSFRTLVADPADGSATKRWWMLLRWLVRPADGVDLGLWRSRRPAELIVPLDTHVGRIAKLVGLTRRGDGSLRAAREITRALARIDPDDPVRFDFALAHLGISGACRAVHDPEVCPSCPLRPVCVEGGYGASTP